jgi:DNA-binding NarL/FixJ family response regulator
MVDSNGPGAPIKILVVDDHPIMRVGVAAMIGKCTDMKVTSLAGSGEDAIAQYAKLRPDVVLLDLRLPGIDGIETLIRMRALDCEARVIVLTMYEGDEDVHRAMEAGAKGYLLKGLPSELLLASIRKVYSGGVFIPAACPGKIE